jgi:hypothetical protein
MMDKTQATEIEKHLGAAIDALHRAGDIILDLDKADRTLLAIPLAEIVAAVHSELLEEMYTRYPDLRPPQEVPTISSTLRWDDVTLPEGMSEADLDAIIFSAMSMQYRKVARIIGDTLMQCGKLGRPISDEMVGARIQELDETRRLESQGDLRKWRFSEVRLKR